MLRFCATNLAKEKLYVAKKPINIWEGDVMNILIPNLIETKSKFKYWIGYLDEVIKPLVLMLPKVSEYVKTFKDKGK